MNPLGSVGLLPRGAAHCGRSVLGCCAACARPWPSRPDAAPKRASAPRAAEGKTVASCLGLVPRIGHRASHRAVDVASPLEPDLRAQARRFVSASGAVARADPPVGTVFATPLFSSSLASNDKTLLGDRRYTRYAARPTRHLAGSLPCPNGSDDHQQARFPSL